MSEFVNTVEIMGDDALIDALIQRTFSGSFNDEFVTKISGARFYRTNNLTSVNFPSVVTVEGEAFAWCGKLTTADFAAVESIGNNAFGWCYAFKTLIIRNTAKVCTLGGAMSNNMIASGTGYIYVPKALVDSYKSATNWSAVSARFRALEDYTVDGTVTGDLDESKIAA